MPIIAGQITGSALTASVDYAVLANKPSGIVSGAAQLTSILPSGTVSSSGQVDYTALSNLPVGVVTSSAQINADEVSGLRLKPAVITSSLQVLGVVTSGSVTAILPAGTISSSAQLPGLVTASSQVSYTQLQNIPADIVSSSAQITLNAIQGTTFATANFRFPQNVTINGVLSASSDITASNLNVNGIVQLQGIPSSSAQVKTLLPDGTVTSSAASSPSQGTVRVTINGVNTDVDTGLQAADSPSFAGLTVTSTPTLQGIPSSSAQVKVLLPDGTVTASVAGDAQGQLKVNGVNVNIPTLQTTSSPTFNTVTANLTGTSSWATTAVSSTNVAVTTDSTTDATKYLGFVDATSGNNAVKVDASLIYNPLANSLTITGGSVTGSGGFLGPVVGTASWATNAITANSATTATTATNATNVAVGTAADNATYYVTFTDNTTGNRPVSTDANSLSYNPSTNTLTVTNVTGTASLATNVLTANLVSSSGQVTAFLPAGTVSSSTQVKANLPDGTVSSSGQVDYNSIQNKLSGVYSSSAFSSPSQGTARLTLNGVQLTDVDLGVQTGDQVTFAGVTSSLFGTSSWATNALSTNNTTNVGVTNDATTDASRYLTFVDATSGNNAIKVDSALIYNPLSNTLSNNGGVLDFASVSASLGLYGTASWAQNVAGTIANATNATNATNVAVGTAADSATYYVTFTDNTTGNRPTFTDANSLSYNPGTNTLTVTTVSGNLTGTASLATNALTAGLVSSSTQVKANLPAGTVSSSGTGITQGSIALNGVDVSAAGLTAASNPQFAGLTVTSTPALAGIPSSSAQVKPLLPDGTISSSTQVNAILDADGVYSSSSQVQLNLVTGTTFATADFTFPQNLTVGGQLTAERFVTEYISSSIIFESGSSKFGDTADDVMSVTGSIRVLGGSISGSMVGMFSSSGQVSYSGLSSIPSGIVSSSTQVAPLLPAGTVSSSTQIPTVTTATSASVSSTAAATLHSLLFVDGAGASKNLLVDSNNLTYTPSTDTLGVTNLLGTASIATKLDGLTYTKATDTVTVANITSTGTVALAGVVSSSTASSPSQGTVRLTVNGTNTDVDTGLQTGDSPTFSALTVTNAITATAITASGLTANQAIFTNASDGFVSNAITGTGNVVMSASPTLTGTLTAANITANGTLLLQGIFSSSTQVDYNSIQNKLSGVVSSSTQVKPLLPDGTVTASAAGDAQGQIKINGVNVNITTLQAASTPTFAGVTSSLFGTSSWATNAVTATNSTNVAVTADSTTDATRYITFVDATSGNNPAKVDASLIYNPLANSLTITGGSVTGSGGFLGPVVGTASWATNAVNFSGNAATATTATNATNVAIGTAADSATYYVTFTDNTTGNRPTFTDANSLSYNPGTNTLTVASVVGTSSLATNALTAGLVSSSAQVVAGVASQTIAPTTVNASIITASALTANQAVFTNGDDGLVSNAITGTGNVVMSASPTFTGTITAASITANGTVTLQGIYSSSAQVDYNSIQNKLSGVYSSSAFTAPSQGTLRLTLNGVALTDVDTGLQTGDGPTFAGMVSTAIVSGSGASYRLVIPVGTNYYAT